MNGSSREQHQGEKSWEQSQESHYGQSTACCGLYSNQILAAWLICGSESDLSQNAYDGFKVSATTLPSWLENRKTSSALVAKSYLNVLDFFFFF